MSFRGRASHPRFNAIAILMALSAAPVSAAPARPGRLLSFEERVAAQEAIERVYYAHQIGATQPFEDAVPREVLEKKVRSYLEQSAALDEIWKTPITAAALRAELIRIAAGTRFPDRLEAIYHALGDDPVLVLESFARPVLVDRMARSFFASDERIHGERREEAEAAGRAEMATDETRRIAWDEWWSANRGDLRWREIASVAGAAGELPLPRRGGAGFTPGLDADGLEAALSSCLPDDTWPYNSLGNLVGSHEGHTVVWTGSVMVAWGGVNSDVYLNTGGRYDPLTDTWTATSFMGAPSPRAGHSAVWTGSRMIVWGGQVGLNRLNTGARYDPVADVWTPTSTVGAPVGSTARTAVWTGSVMIVWTAGGTAGGGGRYDPAGDSWAPMSEVGQPVLGTTARTVWTGTVMIAFGRSSNSSAGGRYDPVTDTWATISLLGAPPARSEHSAIWTGSSMIVWGGKDLANAEYNTGGRYDPVADTWSATSTTNAPSARRSHVAVWTGTEMLIWGGRHGPNYPEGGGRYDSITNTWTAMSSLNEPERRNSSNPAVWTGSLMLFWGGDSLTGGRYDPAADLWTPIASLAGPTPRNDGSAVWTGSLMVLWGGYDSVSSRYFLVDIGERYDPLTDSWSPTSTLDAPLRRAGHSALWTGSRMIVWGVDNTGGRYDPVADTWSPTSTVNAPPPPTEGHVAVWTGKWMVVWGNAFGEPLAHGGRYDPAADVWLPISEVNAPVSALRQAAVWTGTRMVVWSGGGDTDGRYDPELNLWTPVSTVNAPAERWGARAVWTGSRMIVWGGNLSSLPFTVQNTGGLYDPVADAWLPTSTTNAPPPREYHTSVWTGNRMIVWGGQDDSTTPMSTGGRYDPVADSWAPTALSGAPSARAYHTAVWTGSSMIIAGGYQVGTMGGEYAWGQAQDLDGDGYSPCAGDCDDASMAIHPAAAEVCDGRDTDCDGIVPGSEYDADGDGVAGCGDCNDADPLRYPGNQEGCDGIDNDCNGVPDQPLPPETNNGLDEQCAGDPGFGLIDEISGISGFFNLASPATYSWPPQNGATLYEALRSNRPDFASGCDWTTTVDPFWVDTTVPAARSVLYYLVRPLAPHPGSLGKRSSGVERTGLCGVERSCDDGLDDDADGKTDCADAADCYGESVCDVASLTFVDTAGNDLAPTAIQAFLTSVPVSASDFIRVSLTGPSVADFDVCLARADFYKAQYLALAPTDGIAVSGSWNKWHRTEPGGWIGPETTARDNWFGDSCAGAYSWCVETGLGGHLPGMAPGEAGLCEAFDDITCSDGTWSAAIVIGVDRLSACGF